MAQPKETWIAAVVLQLEKIRQENGYTNDIGTVFRVDVLPDQLNAGDFPALFVLDPLGGGVMQATGKHLYSYRLTLTIGGIVNVGTSDTLSRTRATRLNHLINDIWRSLLEDETFGGSCKDSTLQDGPAFIDVERGHGLYNCELTGNIPFQRSDL